eukprot:g6200.t1
MTGSGAAEKEADIGKLLVTGIADIFLKDANLQQQLPLTKHKQDKKKSSNRKTGSAASKSETWSCSKTCRKASRPENVPSTSALKQQKIEFASRYLRDPFAESDTDLSLYVSTIQCITENRDIPFKALAWEVGTSEIETVCILRKARREKRRHAEYFHEALDLWSCVDAPIAAAAGVSFGKAQRLLRKAKQLDQEPASSKNPSKLASEGGCTSEENSARPDEDEYFKSRYWPFNVEPDFPHLLEYEDPIRIDAMHFANLSERFMVREVQTKRTGTDPKTQKVWMQKPAKSEETVNTTPNGIQTYFSPIHDEEESVDPTKPRPLQRVTICAPGTLDKPFVAARADAIKNKTAPKKIEWVPADPDTLFNGGDAIFSVYGHVKSILSSPYCDAKMQGELINGCGKMEHTLFDSFTYERGTDHEKIRMSRVRPLRIMCTGRLPPGFENFRNFFEAGGTLGHESDFMAAKGGFLSTEAYMMDFRFGDNPPPGIRAVRKESANAKGQLTRHWKFVRDNASKAEIRKAFQGMDQGGDLVPNPGDLVRADMDERASMVSSDSDDSDTEDMTHQQHHSGEMNNEQRAKIALAADHQGVSAPYTRYDAYMKAEAAERRGLQKRLARDEKRKNRNTPATIAIGPKGEAVTLPEGVTRMKNFVKVNTNTPENVDKPFTQLFDEYTRDAKAGGAGGAGDDSSDFRDFADEHIEVTYSLPPEADASLADFGFEQFFWRCIEDGRTDMTTEEAACGLLLQMNEEESRRLLNVEKGGGGKGVELRTTVRGSHYVLHGPGGSATVVRDHKGNVQKTGNEIMKTLKRIAFVAGGGKLDSPSDGAVAVAGGLASLQNKNFAQMLADGNAYSG